MNIQWSVLVCGMMLAGVDLAAADTKMAFSELPPAVQRAAKAQMQGARLVGAGSEEENGKTTYEVETKVGGKSRDLSFDASGKLLEVEQEVDVDSIPAPAKAALMKGVGPGTIHKVESVTAGNAVSYEASVTMGNGKKAEVAVNADGTRHQD